MAFERFTKTGSRIGTPKVSIWSKGQIGFNRGAMERFKLNDFRFSVLFYDKETKTIGFKFTNDNAEKGAIKMIFRKGGGVSLSGSAFLNYYGIDHSVTTKYNLEYDKENDLYVFKLE